MYCPSCGADVGDSKFCPRCGTNIQDPAPAVVPAIPAYEQKVVNKVAFVLLAFFLGGFGIHRFYAGRILSGVIYLLCFWSLVPAILAFIEFIIALARDSDQNGNIIVDPARYFI